MNISKSKWLTVKKLIKSLQIKKYRKQEQSFIVQGTKSVQELLQSDFETILVAGTPSFLDNLPEGRYEVIETNERELASIGEFQSNEAGLAIARMKPNSRQPLHPEAFTVVLDDIRDPGNLGTIIRTCDWYGINQIIASEETADFYNPKVISATMGSFTRTSLFYGDLVEELRDVPVKVYGAFLDGRNVHQEKFGSGGVLVIGNESRGISPTLEPFITDRITIPRYGHAESLNAAVATAIICDNIRRK